MYFTTHQPKTVIPFYRIRMHWDRHISYLDIILRHSYVNMKNISKNISTVCPGCDTERAEVAARTQNRDKICVTVICTNAPQRSRCESVLPAKVYIALSANRILNYAIDRRRDLINHANIPPVFRDLNDPYILYTEYVLYTVNRVDWQRLPSISRVVASFESGNRSQLNVESDTAFFVIVNLLSCRLTAIKKYLWSSE